MADKTGAARLRQAIKNQRDAGEGEFRLTYHDAEEIAAEIEGELARLAWAKDVPVPKDADGEVVPLATEVMYTDRGQKIELGEFYLLHSVPRGGSVWRAIRHTDHGIKDFKLAFLHLRRPDSWEKLLEDLDRCADESVFGFACAYFDEDRGDCATCNPDGDTPCERAVILNIASRIRRLRGDAE